MKIYLNKFNHKSKNQCYFYLISYKLYLFIRTDEEIEKLKNDIDLK